MSIRGQSFSNYPTGAHIAASVGGAGGLYSGAFTVAMLMKISSSSAGLFGGFSGGIGGTSRGGLLLSSGSLFGNSDFSSGFGGGALNDGAWRWFAYSKAAGAAHYRMHVADLATLTWSHGESSGAGNHGDTGTSDEFSLGMNENYALGFATSDLAAGAVWTSQLSDAAIEAALTQAAGNLAGGSPTAGWLFRAADFGSPYLDFTGGGADETSRTDLISSTDPADFDFSLGPNEGSVALVIDLALAASGARKSAGTASVGLGLGIAAGGARASVGAAAVGLGLGVSGVGARISRGAAALGLRYAINAVGPHSVRPSKLTARAARPGTRARGTTGSIKARGGYGA